MPHRGPDKAGSSGLFRRAAAACATALILSPVLSLALPTAAAAQPIAIDVTSATAAYDRRTGDAVVSFQMSEASRRAFAEFTARNVGRKAEFRLDGRVVMSPVIREPITGGQGQIASGFTPPQAADIAARLSSGQAKIAIEAVE